MDWTPDKIVELRDERGWTQQDLAEAIDVSRRVVQMWEAGKPISKSNARALDRLAVALDRQVQLSPAELARRLPSVRSSDLLAEVARRFALIPAADIDTTTTDLPAGTWRVPTSAAPSGHAESATSHNGVDHPSGDQEPQSGSRQ